MEPKIPRLLVWLVILTLALAVVLALNLISLMRGGYGWRWPYDGAALPRALPVIFAVGLYVVVAGIMLQRETPSPALLAWSVVGTITFSLLIIFARYDNIGFQLFGRTASGMTTGPHMAAAEIDWSSQTLQDWPEIMRSFEGRISHITLAGPGLPLVYRTLNVALDAVPGPARWLQRSVLAYQCQNPNLLAYSSGEWGSAWLGMLMPLWASLGVFVLHGLARDLYGALAARYAALWWPLIPALVMFVPSWSTVFPIGALAVLWSLQRGLVRRRDRRASYSAWLVLAGLILGLLLISSYAFFPMIIVAGVYTLAHWMLVERPRDPAAPWSRPIQVGVWFGVGSVAPWLILWISARLSPVDVLQTAQEMHLQLDRPYLPWLFLHTWDWFVLTGPPLIVLWLADVKTSGRRLRDDPPLLSVALLVTILVMVLSGTSRGETGRVWLPYSGFVVLAASHHLARLVERGPAISRSLSWGALTAAQAVLMLALALTWNVIGTEFVPPPPAPDRLDTTQATDVRVDDLLRLVGWSATVTQDEATGAPVIALLLNWQADQRSIVPYFLAALPVSPSGTAHNTTVWPPDYPATCWAPGTVLGLTMRVRLPADAEVGEWWISLSVLGDARHDYQPATLHFPDGSTDTQVGLGPIAVP